MFYKHTSIFVKYSAFLVHYIGVCSRKILDERFFGVNAGLPEFSLSNLREFIFLRGRGGGRAEPQYSLFNSDCLYL